MAAGVMSSILGVVFHAELVSLTSSSYPSPRSPYSSEE